MSIQSGIITELEARHHSKEFKIKAKIDELNAVIIETNGISEEAAGVIQSLKDAREEAKELYRHEISKFEAYMKRKNELEEAIEKDYTYEDVLRHIERDAIENFFDD